MIAAGVNVKALSAFMGHANITVTLDQYGHLLPGAEDEAAGLLDAFLARQLGGAEDSAIARSPSLRGDPRELSDEELERRLRERAFERGLELQVEHTEAMGWSALLKTYKDSSRIAPRGATIQGVDGANSRREALEALWHNLDLGEQLGFS